MELSVNEITHAVYIIHTKPCIDIGQPIYKIGRTCQRFLKRYESYPHGSQLHIQFRVRNSFDIEKQIITIFKQCFIHRNDFGYEYFEGNLREMTQKMFEIVQAEPEFEPESELESKPIIQTQTGSEPESEPNSLHEVPRMVAADRICPTCHKYFSTNSSFIFHSNRKTPCVASEINNNNDNNIDFLMKKYKCKRCNYAFQTSQNLTIHMGRKKPCAIRVLDQQVLIDQLVMNNQHQQNIINQLS